MSSLGRYSEIMLPAIEAELQQTISKSFHASIGELEEMQHMLAFHMGWEGEGAGPEARGKRIRPLILLLSAASAGGEWSRAMPGAIAVELVHNFSLVHDDIQDQSLTRRGRPTLWSRWGTAQAINAGDALFALAQLTVLRLDESVSKEAALEAGKILQETCLSLTQGQYLDLSYEQRRDLSVADYWPMVSGKTAALLSASTFIGALCAQADPLTCQSYQRFGELLGLAFQVQDDMLGIWGDAALTGKSTASDLAAGKKTLPVLYALSQGGAFAEQWNGKGVTPAKVKSLSEQLEAEGARAFVSQQAEQLTKQALETLSQAGPQGEAGEALGELADHLLKRKL